MSKAKLLLTTFLFLLIGLTSGCSDENDAASGSSTGTSTQDGSLGDSEPTGRIVGDNFFVLYDPAIPEVFNSDIEYTRQSVVISANADDLNELVEVSGQTVNFRAEWGSWLDDRDSCVLTNGVCTVTWISGNPATAPGSCLVAITAWTVGEEPFADANDNNIFDSGEAFADFEEPFLDVNGDGTFTAGFFTTELEGELIDIINFTGTTPGTRDGIHNPGNGLYDGSLCAAGNASCNTARDSMIIHTRSTLQIQVRFDEPTGIDVNGNGTLDETNILFCGFNNH